MNQDIAEVQLYVYIKDEMRNLFAENVKVHTRLDISDKKLRVISNNIAPDVLPEAIVAYADGSHLVKGIRGFIITTQNLYHKDFGDTSTRIPFQQISSVQTNKKKIIIQYGQENVVIDKSILNEEAFIPFLEDMKQFHKELESYDITPLNDRILTLDEMSKEVRVNYVKCLIDYEKKCSEQISPSVMSEIMGLMTQLGYSKEMRNEIKQYILFTNSSLEDNFQAMLAYTPRGNEHDIRISLLKDFLRVTLAREKKSIANTRKFDELNQLLQIQNFTEVVNLLRKSIENDKKLVDGQITEEDYLKDLNKMKEYGKQIQADLHAIYMGGSIVGLSAGRVAQLFPGIGIMAMLPIPGAGALAISGVVVYSTYRYLSNQKDKAKKIAKKREKMIQEIIMMHQATINNLIEDIEDYTDRVNDLLQQNLLNENAISELRNQMNLFKNVLSTVKKKETVLHSELEVV